MENNVIELPRAQAQPATADPAVATTANRPAPLAPQQAQAILGAIHRLKEIGGSTIVNPRVEAEQTGLVNFLHNELLSHAEEFMGCWIVCREEYEPLIQGFTGVLRRSLNSIDAQHKAQAAQVQQTSQ